MAFDYAIKLVEQNEYIYLKKGYQSFKFQLNVQNNIIKQMKHQQCLIKLFNLFQTIQTSII